MRTLRISLMLLAAVGTYAQQQPTIDWMWSPGIGVYASTITPALVKEDGLGRDKGLLVLATMRGGPADKAGLKPGDIIVTMSMTDAWTQEGKSSRIDFMRGSQTLSGNLVSGKISAAKATDIIHLDVAARPPQTFVVDPGGSGNFTTIAGALFHSKSGDTIVIKPGLYKESVFVRPGVTIRPSEKSLTRIETSGSWLLKGPGAFDISDLIFSQSGLRIENAEKTTLSGNTFLVATKQTGVVLVSSSNVTVAGCNFQGTAESSGIEAYGSQFEVSDGVFADHGSWAISLMSNSKANIHKNLLQGNRNGVTVYDSSLTAERNILTGDWDPDKEKTSGIGLRAEKSTVTFNKNSMRRYFRGVVMVNDSVPATLSDNTLTQSQYAVILLGSNANITKNLIIQNQGSGVYIGMPDKQKQSSPQEVTITQNTISQNATAIDAETFNHVIVKENLIEANQWGVRAVHSSISLENNTIALQKSTAINLEKGTDARMYNNIVALNGFGIFAHVDSRRESGYNDVFGNLVNNDFPLHDGNYGRSDYYTTHDKRKVPIEVYPAYDMKSPTDLSVDPGFTKVGSDYTLKPTSALAKIRGEGGRNLGAFVLPAAPARQTLAAQRKPKAAAKP
jgi:hypothetical protein